LLGLRAHLEASRGSPQQNKEYCTKEPRLGGPWEFGEMGEQGKRCDIKAFVDAMKEKLLSPEEVEEKFPLIAAKYPRFEQRIRNSVRLAAQPKTVLVPRAGWQAGLFLLLQLPIVQRKARWYYEETGGAGKSYFASHYRHGDGQRGYVVDSGKHADICHAYAYEPVVFFDWPRSNEDLFPYSMIEKFHNGRLFSPKYESHSKVFSPPHTIIFANFKPDRSKLSEDRWDVHVINNNPL